MHHHRQLHTLNGTPTGADSSFEQTHNMFTRHLEIRSAAPRLITLPIDTMRDYESATEEKEEGQEHIHPI
jgi:hypothetical protein|tara:strand:- start:32040 stop:32249 length:210 start_codon:yes stop_codon:yes gene_type:complete